MPGWHLECIQASLGGEGLAGADLQPQSRNQSRCLGELVGSILGAS